MITIKTSATDPAHATRLAGAAEAGLRDRLIEADKSESRGSRRHGRPRARDPRGECLPASVHHARRRDDGLLPLVRVRRALRGTVGRRRRRLRLRTT